MQYLFLYWRLRIANIVYNFFYLLISIQNYSPPEESSRSLKEDLKTALEDLGSANSKNISLEEKLVKEETENSNLLTDIVKLKQELEEWKLTEEKNLKILEEKEENFLNLTEVKSIHFVFYFYISCIYYIYTSVLLILQFFRKIFN